MDFVKTTGLPPATAIVLSGGGVHVYWISDKPLSVTQWQAYAEGLRLLAVSKGLKADTPLTIDSARVLRVPGTYNHKTTPPRAVKLAALADNDLDFPAVFQMLPVVTSVTAAVTPHFDLSAWGKPPAAMAALDPSDSLSAGLHQYDDVPLDPTEVFRCCPHFLHTAQSHGKGHVQGLWMLDVLASTFFEDGRRWAHYLSKGHPGYSKEETDAMYDRKTNDRAERRLGWPSCSAIANEGCKDCASCQFKTKIKSPLNLALPAARPNQVSIIEHVKEGKINPVVALMKLRNESADTKTLLAAMNENYAAVRYGSKIVVASIVGQDVEFLNEEDFHKMFANLVIYTNEDTIKVSKHWFGWPGRRQFLGRGVVFEPGGPLEIADDMLNLWRGSGIEPEQGDWSLMRNHILNVLCSGQQGLFDYLLNWMAYAVQYPNEPRCRGRLPRSSRGGQRHCGAHVWEPLRKTLCPYR